MIFDLVKDFADVLKAMPEEHPRRRILKLLDEAIRRDVHFIDRHPTTFFQCMWNTCWWYDCPDNPGPGNKDEALINEKILLSDFMQDWREHYESVANRPWLRSLRHPKIPLGSKVDSFGCAAAEARHSLTSNRLVSLNRERTAFFIWDLQTGEQVFSITMNAGTITAFDLDPAGEQIVFTSSEGMIQLWNIVDAGRVNSVDIGQKWSVVKFSKETRTFSTASQSGKSMTFDCDNFELLAQHDLEIDDSNLTAVAISNDATLLAVGDMEGNICVYDLRDKSAPKHQQLVHQHRYFKFRVYRLEFHPENNILAVIPDDWYGCRIVLVDLQDGPFAFSRMIEGYGDLIVSVTFSSDGKHIAAAGGLESGYHNDNSIRVWELSSRKEVARFDGHSLQVGHVSFAENSASLSSVGTGSDETIRIWDINDSSSSDRIDLHKTPISKIKISPTANVIGTNATRDQSITIWNAETFIPEQRLTRHRSIIQDFAFSPDGVLCMTGSGGTGTAGVSDDYSIHLWLVGSLPGGHITRFDRHANMVNIVGFIDNEVAYSAAADNRLVFYDFSDSHPGQVIYLEDRMVEQAEPSPNRQFLLTMSTLRNTLQSQIVTLWDWRDRQIVHQFDTLENSILEIGFSEGGSVIVALTEQTENDISVLAWDMESGKQISAYPPTKTAWKPRADQSFEAAVFQHDEWVLTSPYHSAESSLTLHEKQIAIWPYHCKHRPENVAPGGEWFVGIKT